MFKFLKRKKANKVITLDLTEIALKEKKQEKMKKKRFLFNLFALGAGLSLVVMPLKAAKADGLLGSVFSSSNKEVRERIERYNQALSDIVQLLKTKIDVPYDELSEEDKEKVRNFFLSIGKDDISVEYRYNKEGEESKKCREELLRNRKIPFDPREWNYLGVIMSKDPLRKVKRDRFSIILLRDVFLSLGLTGQAYFPGDRYHFNEMIALILKDYFDDKFDILLFWNNDEKGVDYEKLEKSENLKYCYGSFVPLPVLADKIKTIDDIAKRDDKRDLVNHLICPFVHLDKSFDDFRIIKEKKGDEKGVEYLYRSFYETTRNVILWLDKEFGKKGRGMI